MPPKTIPLPRGLRFDAKGLIPAVVQHYENKDVLMMAYMNREAIRRTLRTGQVHFWSRSRKALWHKGATSGNFFNLKTLRVDCDGDTLLVLVDPLGPACHTGKLTCFFKPPEIKKRTASGKQLIRAEILDKIFGVIMDRKRNPKKQSYVSHLLSSGRDAILKKIGEESSELIIGSKNNRRSEIIWETADVWFHSLVLLGHHGISPSDIYRELDSRFGKPSKPLKSRRTQK